MKNRLQSLVLLLSMMLLAQIGQAQFNNCDIDYMDSPCMNGDTPCDIFATPDSCAVTVFFDSLLTCSPSGVFVNTRFSSAIDTTTMVSYDSVDLIPVGSILRVVYYRDILPGFQLDSFAFFTAIKDSIPPTFNVTMMSDTADVEVYCPAPIPPVAMPMPMDNCDAMVDTTITETITITSPFCPDNYTIHRTWIAEDDSGNTAFITQEIEVYDTTRPAFVAPMDITIECTDSRDTSFTGNILNVMDACGMIADTTFSDGASMTDPNCPAYEQFVRTFTVTDVCGNAGTATQTITVVDSTPPTFTPTTFPDTVIISCENAIIALDTIGMPTNVMDNCDANPTVINDFPDFINSSGCSAFYERIWYVEDACGNVDSLKFIIEVVDTIAPMITMQAQDITVECGINSDIGMAYTDWINTNGGATATDNCTNDADLLWIAEGSNPIIAPACPTPQAGIYQQIPFDFIARDACGNADTTTAVFTVIDTIPPTIQSCPNDTIVMNSPGLCGANYNLEPPVFTETCGGVFSLFSHIEQQPVSAPPGPIEDTPVNPVTFTFPVPSAPTVAFNDVNLLIDLFNMDAEGATEFFNVYDENGVLLGTTFPTSSQCGSVVSSFLLTTTQLDAYAADGVMTFSVEPNIPVGMLGRFAVNNICANSSIRVRLTYLNVTPADPVYEYSINGGPRVNPGGYTTETEFLPVGSNIITYYVTDCSSNVDSCTYHVKVNDNEPPSMDCPADANLPLATGACTIDHTLNLPTNVSDNCSIGTPVLEDTTIFLTFYEDPNLNNYLAEDQLLQISGVGPNAVTSVNLQINLLADETGSGDFFTILGEDGSTIGTVSGTNCSNVTIQNFTISQATFNTWAADGILDLMAISNIPPSGGAPDDGINPCNPATVMNDGDSDQASFITATVTYGKIEPNYFATGATTFMGTLQEPTFDATHTFNLGTTDVSYVIVDNNGLADTCTFQVNVLDNEIPDVNCQPTFVSINPSGTVIDTIFAFEIDAGSTDNCGIDTMFVTRVDNGQNTVSCQDVGVVVDVVLTVIDSSNNIATCTTFVGVQSENPSPTLYH